MGLTEQGLSAINILLIDGAVLMGFWLLVQRLFIIPERARRQRIYERIEENEKALARVEGWKNAHDGSHKEAMERMAEILRETKEVSKSVNSLSQRLAIVETKVQEKN